MMQTLALLLPLLACQTSQPATETPVVVELFTSEGCSSCPPADAVLADLARRPGVIALAYHVDYWDYLGWKDRFADPAFTTRQRDYARLFATRGEDAGIFTPQMIVQGTSGFVGSDRAKAARAIAAARSRPGPGRLTLETKAIAARIRVRYTYDGPTRGRTLRVSVVEDDLRSDVRRGENQGRTLTHAAVVRVQTASALAARGETELALPADLVHGNARVVAFVQDHTGRIGAAQTRPVSR